MMAPTGPLPVSRSLIVDAYRDLQLELFEFLSDLDVGRAIRVEADVGPLWLHADDQVITPWIRHYRSWEATESAFLRSLLKPGMTVIDVGANVGYTTLLTSRAVGPLGRVLAVEPEPTNYALLCANIWAAGALNVQPIRAAAHRTTGAVSLSLSGDNSGDHRCYTHSSATRMIEVRSVRLDDVLRPDVPVDVVKIDVQGMEQVVVQGMESVIARTHPVLLVEFWPSAIEELGERSIDVLTYYRSLGYSIACMEEPDSDPGHTNDHGLIKAVATTAAGFSNLLLRPIDSAPRTRL